jgi:DNA repair exonuclease SbcCD nuclease subunit
MSGEAYGEVAAGIRGVLDAASKREMAILRRLAKGVTELGQAIISMNADFLSEQEVIRVTNTQFAVIKREEIQGQFDLEVDISTAEVDNQKSQDLSFMLQTIGNSMDFGMTKIILSEIAELKRMPALAYTIKTFEPQPSPAQQRLEELAIQKAELENEELQSQIELNRAKARQAEAQADKTDLDYVEQETGTTHARNMQKQKAQSEGNQNLQVTKALTTPKKEGEAKPDIDAAVGFNELSKRLSNDGIPDRVDNSFERDQQAESDPRFSIYSRFYQPSLDPASNPNMSI